MEEAKKEFMRIVTDTEMQEAVVVILANKQDMPKALSAEEIAEMFDVNTLTADRPTPITVRPICAKDGTDSRLEEAIEYMVCYPYTPPPPKPLLTTTRTGTRDNFFKKVKQKEEKAK